MQRAEPVVGHLQRQRRAELRLSARAFQKHHQIARYGQRHIAAQVLLNQREREVDEEGVRTTRGVGPTSIPDLLALTGDSADGIPGLPGFGDKSAAAVLAAFERLEQIPDDHKAWPKTVRGAERLATTLRAQRDDALLYRKLATLRTDVPLREDLSGLEFVGVPKAQFEAWCDVVGTTSLKARPVRWRP